MRADSANDGSVNNYHRVRDYGRETVRALLVPVMPA